MRCKLIFVLLSLALLISISGCRRRPKAQPVQAITEEANAKLAASQIDIGDPAYEALLRSGFYGPEGGWRWTARKFAVTLTPPPGREATLLVLDFSVHPDAIKSNQAVTLTAKVAGVEVGRRRYAKAGKYQFVALVPPKALEKQPAIVEFEIDKTFRTSGDDRELGLIAVSAELTHGVTALFDRETEVARAHQGYQYLLTKRGLLLPPEKQTEMMKLFHEIPIWHHMFFQNVPIEKSPLDLWMMQQIIYETQPDFIVETGTWMGGSALYWAHTLNGMGMEQSRVLTVDIQDCHATAAEHPLWKKYVTFFLSSSTDLDLVSKIAALVKGKKTLITLDSDHSMGHVLQELDAYAPLVSPGSYIVVEDTHLDGVPTDPTFGPGPMAAVRKFLEQGGAKKFEQDLTREAYVMTFNPGGWLKRRPGR
jgi:cephalosporin hydroxylase